MRFAIIDTSGAVYNVIVADDELTAARIASDLGHTAREVATELETPSTSTPIVSRGAQPGARLVERDAAPGELARSRRRGMRDVVDDFETPAPIEGDAIVTEGS